MTPPFEPHEEEPVEPLDIVSKYRKFHELHNRDYQDDEVRSCVFLINMRIKHAVFQGADDLAYGLARLLQGAEPLEERKIDDPQGQNLRQMADLILAK